MKTLYFITGNQGKYTELHQKLSPLKIKVVQKDLGYPEIQADSLQAVVQQGLTYLQQQRSKPFVIEDAGLFIQALNGFPGVYSKYVFFTIGLQGILRLLQTEPNRSATFRSVYGYHDKQNTKQLFTGECHGIISPEKRGTRGFGYDPLFIPDGDVRTFAEMNMDEKNMVSHRGQAINQLIAYLQKKK